MNIIEKNLLMLERANDIPQENIKRIDGKTFHFLSVNPKNQDEVTYMVYNGSNGYTCTCPSFLYNKTPEAALCKHIIRATIEIVKGVKAQ